MLSTINTLVSAYIQFMSVVGSVSNEQIEQVYVNQISFIFSEKITKIENACIIVVGHQELSHQLQNARKYAFPWTMEILDLVIDEERRAAAVRFTWNSDKIGLHITTAILKFDENDKITEINEVYNKFTY